jgi:hypothetical protein
MGLGAITVPATAQQTREEELATAQAAKAMELRPYVRRTPIVTPTMDDSGTLTFHNAATDRGVAAAPGGYRARWLTFDNMTRETHLIAETAAAVSRMPAPRGIPTLSRSIMKIDVSATGAPYPS